jgi:hypothetical protein
MKRLYKEAAYILKTTYGTFKETLGIVLRSHGFGVFRYPFTD